MYKNKPRKLSEKGYLASNFNKRIVSVIDKYGYVSLDGIIRIQYYYPFKNNGFSPIKYTGKKE
ncbi:hypothetical protein UA38_20050 [Photobacterium kishitanii]|uniref:Uncharacterized protein n=1 Tax=Photobacterium kishitanii TaxID=318456 RepID=A0AAX0YNY0_9GAMM|nr:hypothetical protein UA38_20050 [Photobacterium kishitanii]KJG57983.1 hypothetical protein UA42_20570 [Photobacterium kishitanii]KJG63669.1 hypothetical protein UA40_20745 [Photobacterium kishitanii]KJG66393.1 hypothetical protein UA41_20810 [Photobacterium kishitanii]PSX16851.1 hypothetical protein C0W70_22345 [Photobacterium kishitanii]